MEKAEGLMLTEGLWIRSRQTAGKGRAEMQTGGLVDYMRAQCQCAVGWPWLACSYMRFEVPTREFGSTHQALWKVSMKGRSENMGNKWKPRY